MNDLNKDANTPSWAESIVEFIEQELGLDPDEAVPALVMAIGDYARSAPAIEQAELILDTAANMLADEEL